MSARFEGEDAVAVVGAGPSLRQISETRRRQLAGSDLGDRGARGQLSTLNLEPKP